MRPGLQPSPSARASGTSLRRAARLLQSATLIFTPAVAVAPVAYVAFTLSTCAPATFPQQELEMHQLPVKDCPSPDRVKNVSDGQTANGGLPSRESSTFVGFVPDIPTVTRVLVPFSGRFGAPATVKNKSPAFRGTAAVAVSPVP